MSTSQGCPPRWVREGGISGSKMAHCWSVTSEGYGLRGCRSCHIVAHSLSRGDALTISQNIAFAKTCFRIASHSSNYGTRRRQLKNLRHNKALHLTAFPLRSKAAGELGRWASHLNLTGDRNIPR